MHTTRAGGDSLLTTDPDSWAITILNAAPLIPEYTTWVLAVQKGKLTSNATQHPATCPNLASRVLLSVPAGHGASWERGRRRVGSAPRGCHGLGASLSTTHSIVGASPKEPPDQDRLHNVQGLRQKRAASCSKTVRISRRQRQALNQARAPPYPSSMLRPTGTSPSRGDRASPGRQDEGVPAPLSNL